MRIRKSGLAIFTLIAIIVLISDAKTAFQGSTEGIEICIRTLIPSLFPFFVLSTFLTGQLSEHQWKWLHPLGRILHLPHGAEMILLISFLGGYPVGAQCIQSAYGSGAISREDAQRMLCFCNNAGPAFIFGIGGHLFGSTYICSLIWLIHIFAALLIGMIIPPARASIPGSIPIQSISFTDSIRKSLESMGMICSWIILFRIILSYMDKWLLRPLPQPVTILLSGLLELTNGCTLLEDLPDTALRFIVISAMLGFGGICVVLQSRSVLSKSGLTAGSLIVGKALHGTLSCSISALCAQILFGNDAPCPEWIQIVPIFILTLIFCLLCTKFKRGIAFLQNIVYNQSKFPGGITYEAVPQKR